MDEADSKLLIPVSVFESKDDNRPSEHSLSWQDLAERLCKYEERPTKDGRAWSPVKYKPGTTRGKANVEAVYALVLDFDHGAVDWELIDSYEYVGHTTFQHTREAPRWRVSLPLTRPISGQDWPAFWLRSQAFFGGCVDAATKDSSRIFYLPSCPPGADHDTRRHHGQVLDPDSLPAVPQYAPPPRVSSRPPLLERYLNHWAARFCQTRVDELGLMLPDTGRNNACNRAAYLLAGLAADPRHDLGVNVIAQQLFDACVRNRLVDDDGEHSVRATIQSGLEDGLLRPWSPADQESAADNVRPFVGRTQQDQKAVADAWLAMEQMGSMNIEPIRWLWRNRLARGKATLLMGDPGIGKSLISHWLAAMVSQGGAWPDEGACDPGAAILFTIEDGLADTVAPRLLAAGANMDRVWAVTNVKIDLGTSIDERMFALDEHVKLLEREIEQKHATLVVMDPITAYLGANVNAHKDTDVRRVLAPLQMMAERTDVALLLLMHLTKGTGVSALYRATGSIAFPAVCRVVLGVAPDPNDSEGKRRLLLPIKFNIAPEAIGIGYRIETIKKQILPRADARDQPPIIVWDDEPVLVDATSAMDRSGTVEERGALAECKRALLQIMADGSILSSEGMRQLKEAGASTSPATVQRARTELGIESRKDGRGPWYWYPPRTRIQLSRARGISDGLNSSEDLKSEDAAKIPEGFTKNPNGWSHNQSQESKDFEESSRARETWWMKDDDRVTPGELCPVHHKSFDEHDCDAL